MGTRITGLGHHAPTRVVVNAEIEARLGLEPGWIFSRLGLARRRYAAPNEALTDIARPAAAMALAQAARDDIGFLLLATSTPDHLLPPSAPLLAHQLGLRCGAADLAGACSGFIDALALADGMARARGHSVLVVAANILSRRIDSTDASTSALFADAAGAIVLSPAPNRDSGVVGAEFMSDGSGYDLIHIPAGGSREPIKADIPLSRLSMSMSDGRAVFGRAIEIMETCARTVLTRARVGATDIALWAPHQANPRITTVVGRRLGLDPTRTASTFPEFGNSSAATIPFTLSHGGWARGLAEGDLILFSAVGAGLTGGAVLFRW